MNKETIYIISFRFLIITILLSIICLSLNCQESAESHYKKGKDYADSERYDDAIREYEEAVKIDPKYVDAYYSLGWTQYCIRKYNEALNNFKKCISLDPNSYKGYKGIAAIFAAQGYHDLAIENYKKAISLSPNLSALYSNIAYTYVKIGNYDEAILNAKKGIELEDIADSYHILGKVYLLKGNYDEAIAIFERGLSNEFREKKFKHYILANLAIAYAIQGQRELALSKINEAIQLGPDISRYKQIYEAIKIKASKKWLLGLVW